MNFEKLYWHDSEILDIQIDRKLPGKKDIILLEINWQDIGLKRLIFENVYWARLTLNFGIVATESIDTAFIAESDDVDLNNFYNVWNFRKNELKLNCYVI